MREMSFWHKRFLSLINRGEVTMMTKQEEEEMMKEKTLLSYSLNSSSITDSGY
jgi:hypothetical protein